ncbi:MAG: hypothetical protein GU356_02615 [Pyrobaculum sp.]|nr:hypothetical protein [Pyrobaculum sp.]
MPRRLILLLFSAVLLSAQGAVFQPAVDFLFLGAQWVDVPKFPGDFGLLKLSFFLADQHVDVSVSLSRCGLYAEPVRSLSAGPGVYEAILKVRADRLGVSEGCTAVFRSRYVYKSGALSGGVEKVEYAEVYIPPYPSPQVAAVGGLTIGVKGRVLLRLWDSFRYNGTVEVSAVGARLYGPVTFRGDLGNFTAPLEVAPLDFSASLTVTIRTRDALGREVVVARQVPLSVKPRPTPIVVVEHRQWVPSGCSSVGLRVMYPMPVNGTVYAMHTSAPLERGETYIWPKVCADGPYIVIPVTVQLDTGAVDKVELQLPVYQTQPTLSVSAEPTVLVMNDINKVVVKIRGAGAVEGVITVSGGIVLGQHPVPFFGVDAAEVVLNIIPTSPVVTLDVSVAGVGRTTINLVASQRAPVDVWVEPAEVPSGGREMVRIYVRPRVNVSEVAVTLYPVSGVVFPQRTVYLGAGGVVDLPVEVPADVVGNVAIGYKVSYVLASGVSGEYVGTLYLVALQRPVLLIEASVTPERPGAGDPFYLAVRLYNSGGVEARDVRLNASGVKVVRAPSPLGAVAPQTSRDALFTLVAERPGTYNVTVTATYFDRLGRLYTAQRTVTVVVNSTEAAPTRTAATSSTQSDQLLAVAAVVAVGLALVALGVWRGRAGRSR